jgi:hypothetical protein
MGSGAIEIKVDAGGGGVHRQTEHDLKKHTLHFFKIRK